MAVAAAAPAITRIGSRGTPDGVAEEFVTTIGRLSFTSVPSASMTIAVTTYVPGVEGKHLKLNPPNVAQPGGSPTYPTVSGAVPPPIWTLTVTALPTETWYGVISNDLKPRGGFTTNVVGAGWTIVPFRSDTVIPTVNTELAGPWNDGVQVTLVAFTVSHPAGRPFQTKVNGGVPPST